MQIEISKSYKIVGEVSEHHGDCKGDIITCTGIDEDKNACFEPLMWSNFEEKGNYILCHPKHIPYLEGKDYTDWLATVLEAV